MNTTYLGLTKPAPNTQNWGYALNTNFDVIDREYAALNNQIAILREQMGRLGLYVTDPNYTEVLTLIVNSTNDEVSKIYVTSKLDNSPVYVYESGAFKNMNQIMEYSLFLVAIKTEMGDTVDTTDKKITFKNQEWAHNDVAVKCTKYNIATQSNEPQFIKMHQTIGGYYIPIEYVTASNGCPALTYQRRTATESVDVPDYTGPAVYLKPTSVVGNTVTFTPTQCKPTATGYEESALADADLVQVTYPQITMRSIELSGANASWTDDEYILFTAVNKNDYNLVSVDIYLDNMPVIVVYEIKIRNADKTYVVCVDKTYLSDISENPERLQVVVGYAPITA